MILYHGSRTKGTQTLEPRLADHDQPYIYLSTLEVVAALYLCNGVERPYCWFPYGFRKDNPNVPVYDELYPNGLPEVSEGISGCIYITDIPERQVLPFKNIPCAQLSRFPGVSKYPMPMNCFWSMSVRDDWSSTGTKPCPSGT